MCKPLSRTHRDVYYKDAELFGSQSTVDTLVDNLAYTLGIGRDALMIVGLPQATAILRIILDAKLFSGCPQQWGGVRTASSNNDGWLRDIYVIYTG